VSVKIIKAPHLFVSCKTCEKSNFSLGINENQELVVICNHCNDPVAVISEWPDQELLPGGSQCHPKQGSLKNPNLH
jgi:hypothetical protein